jgi:hypothetical protein
MAARRITKARTRPRKKTSLRDSERQESREAGFKAHIMKSADPDVLANLLVELPAVGFIR